MENPFSPEDSVLTRVKGTEVSAKVSQIYQAEIQVRTSAGELLWRTMFSVWRPGEKPLVKPPRPLPPKAAAVLATQQAVEGAASAEPALAPPNKVPTNPSSVPAEDNSSAQSGSVGDSSSEPQSVSLPAASQPPKSRRKRRRR